MFYQNLEYCSLLNVHKNFFYFYHVLIFYKSSTNYMTRKTFIQEYGKFVINILTHEYSKAIVYHNLNIDLMCTVLEISNQDCQIISDMLFVLFLPI